MAYPTDLDTDSEIGGGSIPAAVDATNSPSHSSIHRLLGDAVQEVQSKVGTGDSTAASGKVLTGTGSGTSGWAEVATAMIADDAVTAAKIHDDAVTKVVVTDTADATCFPALFESATGSLTPETDAGLTYNASNATLTATTFVGALTGNASGTAGVATTVTLTDEGSDTTCFPVFAQTATGNIALETDASALKYNASNGTLTSTTFVGALTGNATTATALDGTTMTGMTVVESDVFEADTDGSAAAPAFTWDDDPSMGLYRAAADCLAVGLNGETAFIATESTNNDGGSSGDGLVGISDYCGGIAGGSAARMITQDIEGIQVKRLAFDSSSREFKSDEAAWGLTDEQFMSIQPTAFTPNGQYVHEGVHYMIGTDGNGEQTVPPEGSLPIRRAGMIQEDVALVDLHLISEAAIDWQAIATATLEKVQRLMERVTALEAV